MQHKNVISNTLRRKVATKTEEDKGSIKRLTNTRKNNKLSVLKSHHIRAKFSCPFDRAVSTLLTLRNPSNKRVWYRMYRAAPKGFVRMRPGHGQINPKKNVQIKVTLKPFNLSQNEDRARLMIKSMYAPKGKHYQKSLWRKARKSKLMKSKLSFLFLTPTTNSGTNDFMANNEQLWQSEGNMVSKNEDNAPKRQIFRASKELKEEISKLQMDIKEEKRMVINDIPMKGKDYDAEAGVSYPKNHITVMPSKPINKTLEVDDSDMNPMVDINLKPHPQSSLDIKIEPMANMITTHW